MTERPTCEWCDGELPPDADCPICLNEGTENVDYRWLCAACEEKAEAE